jgi:hypothetical protein
MSAYDTLGTFRSGARLIRLEAGQLAILLTDNPDRITKPKPDKNGVLRGGGNPAYTVGSGGFDAVTVDGTTYCLTGSPVLVVTKQPTAAEKARAKAADLAAKAEALLAEAERLENPPAEAEAEEAV